MPRGINDATTRAIDATTAVMEQAADNSARSADRMAGGTSDLPQGTGGKARGAAIQLVEQPASTIKDGAGCSMAAAEQVEALPSWAAAELFRAEGDFARVWVELAGTQMTRDAQLRRRLAATRDWHAAMAVSYTHLTLPTILRV